jgi:hypothetical protein
MKGRRKSMVALAIVAIFTSAGLIYAGSLDQADPPAPTMKTLGEVYEALELLHKKVDEIQIVSVPDPRTPILSGEIVITAGGSYYFAENVVSTGDGIIVDADNVTIDLMGFTLMGPGPGTSRGIVTLPGVENVEIRNGSVTRFGAVGIDVYGDGIGIRNMRVYDIDSGTTARIDAGVVNSWIENVVTW